MATITPVPLSGSGTGRGKQISSVTAGAGTAIHTTSSTTGTMDEIWLYAENSDSVTRTLFVEFGGTTAGQDIVKQDIPAGQGLFLVVPGIRLGGGGALIVTAYGSALNVLTVFGNVNRYA